MYNTQLKVTISRYYTPSGRCIQTLDYAHKDKNGAAIRTDEKNTTALKQRKKRL
jgi:carboxyl-terminal processing protease